MKTIVTTAIIKSVNIKPECAELKFNGLQFGPTEYEELAELVQSAEPVVVTMTVKQGRLPFADDSEGLGPMADPKAGKKAGKKVGKKPDAKKTATGSGRNRTGANGRKRTGRTAKELSV